MGHEREGGGTVIGREQDTLTDRKRGGGDYLEITYHSSILMQKCVALETGNA